MRPSELPRPLAALAERLLADARSVIASGCTLSAPVWQGRVLDVSSLATRAIEARYDGAVVVEDADLSAVLGLLRPVLRDGARLLVARRLARSPLAQLRDLVAPEPPPSRALAPLCDALLRRGLVAPRAHDVAPGWVAASAEMPSTRDALDTIFEQPTHPAHR